MAFGFKRYSGYYLHRRVESNNPHQPMKQFVESLGWKYIGDCGCSPKKMMYSNPNVQGFQLWISKQYDKMFIKKRFDREMKNIAVANTTNYETIYNHHIK